MKFVYFGDDGKVVSAHNDDTVSEIPKGATGVSDEQWGDRWNLQLAKGKIIVTPAEVAVEDLAATVRRERARRLIHDVDSINPIRWEQMGDGEKAALREYRQKLLEIPEQKGFPFNVDWPIL